MVKASDCGIYPDTRNTLKVVQIAPFFIFLCSVVFRYTSVSKHQQIIKALHCCCCCWYQESGRLTTKIVSFFLLSLPFTQFWLVGFPPTAPPPPPPVLHAALPRVDLPLWELGLGELDWLDGRCCWQGGEDKAFTVLTLLRTVKPIALCNGSGEPQFCAHLSKTS